MLKGVSNLGTKELVLGIQLERSKGGDMYSGKYFGFNSIEESAFGLLIMFISEKIYELGQNEVLKKKEQLLENTHKFFTELLEQRTIKDFIFFIRQTLASFLGYENSGLLYYSKQGSVEAKLRKFIMHLLPQALHWG